VGQNINIKKEAILKIAKAQTTACVQE